MGHIEKGLGSGDGPWSAAAMSNIGEPLQLRLLAYTVIPRQLNAQSLPR